MNNPSKSNSEEKKNNINNNTNYNNNITNKPTNLMSNNESEFPSFTFRGTNYKLPERKFQGIQINPRFMTEYTHQPRVWIIEKNGKTFVFIFVALISRMEYFKIYTSSSSNRYDSDEALILDYKKCFLVYHRGIKSLMLQIQDIYKDAVVIGCFTEASKCYKDIAKKDPDEIFKVTVNQNYSSKKGTNEGGLMVVEFKESPIKIKQTKLIEIYESHGSEVKKIRGVHLDFSLDSDSIYEIILCKLNIRWQISSLCSVLIDYLNKFRDRREFSILGDFNIPLDQLLLFMERVFSNVENIPSQNNTLTKNDHMVSVKLEKEVHKLLQILSSIKSDEIEKYKVSTETSKSSSFSNKANTRFKFNPSSGERRSLILSPKSSTQSSFSNKANTRFKFNPSSGERRSLILSPKSSTQTSSSTSTNLGSIKPNNQSILENNSNTGVKNRK
jgi:hypothetical protein